MPRRGRHRKRNGPGAVPTVCLLASIAHQAIERLASPRPSRCLEGSRVERDRVRAQWPGASLDRRSNGRIELFCSLPPAAVVTTTIATGPTGLRHRQASSGNRAGILDGASSSCCLDGMSVLCCPVGRFPAATNKPQPAPSSDETNTRFAPCASQSLWRQPSFQLSGSSGGVLSSPPITPDAQDRTEEGAGTSCRRAFADRSLASRFVLRQHHASGGPCGQCGPCCSICAGRAAAAATFECPPRRHEEGRAGGKAPLADPSSLTPPSPLSRALGEKGMRLNSVWFVRRSGRPGFQCAAAVAVQINPSRMDLAGQARVLVLLVLGCETREQPASSTRAGSSVPRRSPKKTKNQASRPKTYASISSPPPEFVILPQRFPSLPSRAKDVTLCFRPPTILGSIPSSAWPSPSPFPSPTPPLHCAAGLLTGHSRRRQTDDGKLLVHRTTRRTPPHLLSHRRSRRKSRVCLCPDCVRDRSIAPGALLPFPTPTPPSFARNRYRIASHRIAHVCVCRVNCARAFRGIRPSIHPSSIHPIAISHTPHPPLSLASPRGWPSGHEANTQTPPPLSCLRCRANPQFPLALATVCRASPPYDP